MGHVHLKFCVLQLLTMARFLFIARRVRKFGDPGPSDPDSRFIFQVSTFFKLFLSFFLSVQFEPVLRSVIVGMLIS